MSCSNASSGLYTLEEFQRRRRAEQMTTEERATELQELFGLFGPAIGLAHHRVAELVNRPIHNTELIYNLDDLVEETKSGQHLAVQIIMKRQEVLIPEATH